VIPPDQRDPQAAIEMLNVLRFGEVEVQQARAAFIADGVEYPKDSYVILMQQPYGSHWPRVPRCGCSSLTVCSPSRR
jgi:hypothetical protein